MRHIITFAQHDYSYRLLMGVWRDVNNRHLRLQWSNKRVIKWQEGKQVWADTKESPAGSAQRNASK